MKDTDLLKEIMQRLAFYQDKNYDRISFCEEHNMPMEKSALQYKNDAYADVRSIIYDLEREILSKTIGK